MNSATKKAGIPKYPATLVKNAPKSRDLATEKSNEQICVSFFHILNFLIFEKLGAPRGLVLSQLYEAYSMTENTTISDSTYTYKVHLKFIDIVPYFYY